MKQAGFILLALFFISLTLYADDIEVGENCDYKTVQEAVKAAQPGDEIIIHEGLYEVLDQEINKAITISGSGEAVLDAGGNGDILLIKGAGITVRGLTFRNTGFSSIKDRAAVNIINSFDVHVLNNTFKDNCFSVFLSGVTDAVVKGNVITGNAEREFSSGNGIHLWKAENISITDNFITRHRDGIYLEFAEDCHISSNKSEKNLRYGLHFMFSDGNRYLNNIFEENGAGVAVMYTSDILMKDNVFNENWGTSSYGLLLKEISSSRIINNRFSRNTVGIYMEACNRLVIEENDFNANGWAIKFLGSCEEDTIRANSFTKNTFDLITNSFTAGDRNVLEGNYWDKYKGYDLDKNRKGDVPHRPVSLFSQYVERIPSSVVLLNSFTVQLLDYVERALPGFIPENFADRNPKMNIEYDTDKQTQEEVR